MNLKGEALSDYLKKLTNHFEKITDHPEKSDLIFYPEDSSKCTPEGMALTCGEDMQLAAVQNVAVSAGKDISAGEMGNMTALVGEKLGLFARTGQLSLKSGEGPVDVQAQNANMRLFAEKKLTLSSASDISFTGKKRITLIGGELPAAGGREGGVRHDGDVYTQSEKDDGDGKQYPGSGNS